MASKRDVPWKCFFALFHCTVSILVRKEKPVMLTPESCYANCPDGWIGFGIKCFYFSQVQRNWTVSQDYCRAQASELARFDSLEEMVRMIRNWFVVCSTECVLLLTLLLLTGSLRPPKDMFSCSAHSQSAWPDNPLRCKIIMEVFIQVGRYYILNVVIVNNGKTKFHDGWF